MNTLKLPKKMHCYVLLHTYVFFIEIVLLGCINFSEDQWYACGLCKLNKIILVRFCVAFQQSEWLISSQYASSAFARFWAKLRRVELRLQAAWSSMLKWRYIYGQAKRWMTTCKGEQSGVTYFFS